MTRIALLADIHGNLEALEAVACDIRLQGADIVVCLGDIVGYGPEPGKCIDLISQLCDHAVMGNHDEAVVEADVRAPMNPLAQAAVAFARDRLNDAHLAYLRELPTTLRVCDDLTVTHACFGPERYAYLYDEPRAADAFGHLPTRIGAVGHTHLPTMFVHSMSVPATAETVRHTSLPGTACVVLPREHRALLNPGSVGQPRDRNPEASWGMLDLADRTFQVRRVWYDVDAVDFKIREHGLPDFHGARLRVGA